MQRTSQAGAPGPRVNPGGGSREPRETLEEAPGPSGRRPRGTARRNLTWAAGPAAGSGAGVQPPVRGVGCSVGGGGGQLGSSREMARWRRGVGDAWV